MKDSCYTGIHRRKRVELVGALSVEGARVVRSVLKIKIEKIKERENARKLYSSG